MLGRPTAMREAEAIEALERLGITVPETIFCSTRKKAGHSHTILVTRSLQGCVSPDAFLADRRFSEDSNVRRPMIEQPAYTLSVLHRAR